MPTLIHHQTVELTTKWLAEGARFVLYSSDARSMHNAYRDEFGTIKAVGAELGGGAADDVGSRKRLSKGIDIDGRDGGDILTPFPAFP